LRVSKTEVAFYRSLSLRIEPGPGRPEILLASLDAFLATDTCPFIDETSVCSFQGIYSKGAYWTGLQTGRISALIAYLGLVVSFKILLFDENPCERRGVLTTAVKIGTDDFTDTASGTERLICENDRFR